MALSANTIFEVRTSGSDTNGGGFVTGASGTDWSQQNAAQYAVTDGVTAGTTTITSATANFGTDVVGNIMYVEGGTGAVAAGFYQITARASSTSITVDRSTGLTAGRGVTFNIGGALANPGIIIPNGLLLYVEGYGTTRGDLGPRPILDAGGLTNFYIIINDQATASEIAICANIELNGQNGTGNSGISNDQSGMIFYKCIARNFKAATTNYGFRGYRHAIACEAYDCGTGFAEASPTTRCYAKACTDYGFNHTAAHVDAIAHNCDTGFETGATTGTLSGCVAYGCTTNGFTYSRSCAYVNCVAVNNGSYGFGGGTNQILFLGCATYNNTTSATQSTS